MENLRNFLGKNSKEFPMNFFRRISQEFLETESQNCDPPKNLSSWGPILDNFSRISKESVTGNDSREIPRKFLKSSCLENLGKFLTFVTWVAAQATWFHGKLCINRQTFVIVKCYFLNVVSFFICISQGGGKGTAPPCICP